MTTISFYNHTRKLYANQEIDVDALKVMLLLDHTFDATDDDVSEDIAGDEVFGFGWDEGGEPVGSEVISIVATSGAMLDAADVEVTATGGAIGPADGAVVYDATSDKPLWYIDFEGEETAGEGTQFRIVWNVNGIARWLAPA